MCELDELNWTVTNEEGGICAAFYNKDDAVEYCGKLEGLQTDAIAFNVVDRTKKYDPLGLEGGS